MFAFCKRIYLTLCMIPVEKCSIFFESTIIADPKSTSPVSMVPSSCYRVPFVSLLRFPLSVRNNLRV
jgi:hypothetical protein